VDLNIFMGLNLALGLIALIAAVIALIGQRRDSQRQVLREKTARQREISRYVGEAVVMQAQVRLRVELLIGNYLRLRRRTTALLERCSDPADTEQLQQFTLRIDARVQRLQQNYDDAHASLLRLGDKNFTTGKKWSDLETLIETLRTEVAALDVGGVKDILGDLETEVAKLELMPPQAAG